MNISLYSKDQQGKGHFGNGEIVESKPIAFPHEDTAVKRVGPLFYWAWAKSLTTFEIPLHPHSGFEIVSYVLAGTVGHRDTLGNLQQVSTGGAQVMQTGSGAYHAEEMSTGTEMFQIWFEPHLSQAVKVPPTYNQHDHEEFPQEVIDQVQVKRIIGADAPVSLVTDSVMQDLHIPPSHSFTWTLPAGYSLAMVAVSGKGDLQPLADEAGTAVIGGDFAVVTTDQDGEIRFTADSAESLRLVVIQVPAEVDYPLYRK
ncbi:pirin family protein [Brevibacillus ruminantium]|uniref:Pirin family protein n=1 Tax=Brevibacillus ruminantium TaxID=2950604 RepID=A0ABY4WHN9_9BACL|nr:pirin family protein [Brevibacillus ruminantium]USG66224.1 pirin family protein [Brevibacillus ruminantium]